MAELKRMKDTFWVLNGKGKGVSSVDGYNADEADAYIRHHKYKRCLAWAAFWEIKSAMLMVVRIGSNAEWYRLKYENRATKWRELAEQFKQEGK